MPFLFTKEQAENLRNWKETIELERNQTWYNLVKERTTAGHKILTDGGFETGTDLSQDQLDEVFHLMRILANNRALASTLYKNNTLEIFNTQLRSLLYGKSPIYDRIESFIELKRCPRINDVTIPKLWKH